MFISEFSEFWSETLATYNNDKLMIVGDFNIHMNDINNCDTKAFNEMLTNFDCLQHIQCPTHESGHTIDLRITPRSTGLNISAAKVDYYLSDHAFIDFHTSLPKLPLLKSIVHSRSLARIHKQSFKNFLSYSVSDMVKLNGEALATQYNRRLSELLDKHAPIKSKRITMRPAVAWFDKNAKALKRHVRKRHHIWRNSLEDTDLTIYKQARNQYRQHLNSKKRAHFADAIQSAHGNHVNCSPLLWG